LDEADIRLRARNVFWRRGYDATNVDDLCEATGLGADELTYSFGGRHAMFVEAVEAYSGHMIASLSAGLESAPSAWRWLLAAVVFDDGRLDLDGDGCFLAGAAGSLGRRDAAVGLISRRAYGRVVAIFEDALRRGKGAGEVRQDVDVHSAAVALLAGMQGIEFLKRAGIDGSVEQAKRSMVGAFVAAYATSTAVLAPTAS
jgi:TetR/AcrR family transcriptional repressor of nem operon